MCVSHDFAWANYALRLYQAIWCQRLGNFPLFPMKQHKGMLELSEGVPLCLFLQSSNSHIIKFF